MNRKRLLIFLVCILKVFYSFPDNNQNTDSLIYVISKQQDDTVKVHTLVELSYIFSKQNNTDSALYYMNKAIMVSEGIENDYLRAKTCDLKGRLLRKQSQYDKALEFHFKAREIAEKTGANDLLAGIYNNIGVTYRRITEEFNALKFHLMALQVAEEINDESNMATAYNSIGIIYTYQENYEDALPYYYLALELAKKRNNLVGVAINLNSIAWVHELMGEYRTAIDFYTQSLEVNLQMDNQKGIAICYADLGKVYRIIGEYDKSLEYYLKTLDINEKVGDKRYIARSHIYLGEVYADLGNYQQSLKELNIGLQMARKLKTRRLIMDGFEQLSLTYEKLGDDAKALELYKKAMRYKDSIYDEEKTHQIAELKTLYDTEKKEKEIQLQKIELAQKETKIKQKVRQRNWFIFGSTLLFITLLVIIRYTIQNQRVNKLLQRQKEEIRTQATKLNRANKEILKNTKIKELFFANTSHEIRNPVNVISGFTNLLLNTELSDKQKSYLENIQVSSNNLIAIVNDILDYSKIEAGKLKIEKVEFNLHDTLKRIYNDMAIRAAEKNLKLKMDIPSNLPKRIIGDPVRLNQVLTNLLTNAIKFTEEGEIQINVEMLTKNYDFAIIQFTVKDTGIGIPEDQLANIFESYSQAFGETSQKYGGTGLGLSIVKRLVDMQDGKISVKSEADKGSEFSFKIPYTIVRKEMEKTEEKSDSLKASLQKKLNILLVDDNPVNRTLASDTIKSFNNQVHIDEAENGKIAVDMLKNKPYDLVLMDLLMPVLDGIEATKIIRNDLKPPKNQTPILGMTAVTQEEERKKCLESGMNEYITKPFEPEEFFRKIAQLTNTK